MAFKNGDIVVSPITLFEYKILSVDYHASENKKAEPKSYTIKSKSGKYITFSVDHFNFISIREYRKQKLNKIERNI